MYPIGTKELTDMKEFDLWHYVKNWILGGEKVQVEWAD